jgi:hypothetical protein
MALYISESKLSPYRSAIDRTTGTIDQRAKYFRNLVMAVVIVSLGSLGWAGLIRRPAALAGILLVLPLCGLFFFLDAKLLDSWRSHILKAWVKKDIDFRAFSDAVNAVPKLPKETLGGMLATLPSPSDLAAEQRVSSSTRQGVAAVVASVQTLQSDAVAWKTAAAAMWSGAVIIALVSRRWEPLLGLAASLALPLLGKRLQRRRLELLKATTSAAHTQPDFDPADYHDLVSRLHWPLKPGHSPFSFFLNTIDPAG